jgi:hypothetical protein
MIAQIFGSWAGVIDTDSLIVELEFIGSEPSEVLRVEIPGEIFVNLSVNSKTLKSTSLVLASGRVFAKAYHFMLH